MLIKPSKILTVITFLIGVFTSCQKETLEIDDIGKSQILRAKLWFNNLYQEEFKSDVFIKGIKFKAKPNWNRAECFNTKYSDIVEIPLLIEGDLGIATEENYKDFETTNDKRLILSDTKLIIEIEKNKTQGFLMTTVPDKEYRIKKENQIITRSYKKWMDFSGAILYHELNGSYSNGWKFTDGKVITAVRSLDNYKFPVDLTKGCIDWYLVTWYTDCLVITKGQNSCSIWKTEQYLFTTCEPGGGGGDGGYQSTPNLNSIYGSTSTLTESQKGLLEVAINQFKNKNSIYAYMWQSIVNSNSCIKFTIDPTLNGAAAISANGLTIKFKSEDWIILGALQEELIHKYQIINYGSNFSALKTNFELEAKIIEDVINYRIGAGGVIYGSQGLSLENGDLYYSWIQNLADGSPFELCDFNAFCSVFHYGNPNSYFDPFFVPNLLIDFASYGFNAPTGVIMF